MAARANTAASPPSRAERRAENACHQRARRPASAAGGGETHTQTAAAAPARPAPAQAQRNEAGPPARAAVAAAPTSAPPLKLAWKRMSRPGRPPKAAVAATLAATS